MKNIENILKDLGIEIPADKKEAFDKELKENYKTISEVEKLKSKNDELTAQLADKDNSIKDLNEKIKGYDGKDTDIKALQEKVTEYEQKEKERLENEKKQKEETELKTRFDSLLGENKWKHSDIETGRFMAFKEALNNVDNKGKGDKEIFEAITKDLDCFVNPQQQKINWPANSNSNDDKPNGFPSFF